MHDGRRPRRAPPSSARCATSSGVSDGPRISSDASSPPTQRERVEQRAEPLPPRRAAEREQPDRPVVRASGGGDEQRRRRSHARSRAPSASASGKLARVDAEHRVGEPASRAAATCSRASACTRGAAARAARAQAARRARGTSGPCARARASAPRSDDASSRSNASARPTLLARVEGPHLDVRRGSRPSRTCRAGRPARRRARRAHGRGRASARASRAPGSSVCVTKTSFISARRRARGRRARDRTSRSPPAVWCQPPYVSRAAAPRRSASARSSSTRRQRRRRAPAVSPGGIRIPSSAVGDDVRDAAGVGRDDACARARTTRARRGRAPRARTGSTSARAASSSAATCGGASSRWCVDRAGQVAHELVDDAPAASPCPTIVRCAPGSAAATCRHAAARPRTFLYASSAPTNTSRLRLRDRDERRVGERRQVAVGREAGGRAARLARRSTSDEVNAESARVASACANARCARRGRRRRETARRAGEP